MTEANIVLQDPNRTSQIMFQNNMAPNIDKAIMQNHPMFNRFYGKHDVLSGEYKLHQKVLAELVGTMIFIFGVCGCGVFATNPVSNLLGGSFMGGLIIFIFGRVSGAHFNPAVSLALFIRQKLTVIEFGLYIAAQIVGAFIGCILVALCRRGKFEEMAANQIQDYLIYTDGGTGKNAWCYISALICEIVMTFILIMYILSSCEKDNYLGPVLGLGFSTTILSMSVVGGSISGASLNPVRSLVPALIQVMAGGDKTPIKQIWIYIVGPLLGSAIAAFLWPIFIFQKGK